MRTQNCSQDSTPGVRGAAPSHSISERMPPEIGVWVWYTLWRSTMMPLPPGSENGPRTIFPPKLFCVPAVPLYDPLLLLTARPDAEEDNTVLMGDPPPPPPPTGAPRANGLPLRLMIPINLG